VGAKPATIDDYLAGVPAAQRAALGRLRKTIRAAAPGAVECVTYGVPAFRLGGKAIVGFGAGAGHCSFYPMTGHTAAAFKADLAGFKTSKGAITFHPDKPLPAALVRKIVKARVAEVTAKPAKAGKRAATPAAGESQEDPAVREFLRALDHPRKRDIAAVRRIILGVSPAVREGVKWNAPSFRTADYFATFFLRATDRVRLVFHRGAKAKDGSTKRPAVADPAGLIEWVAPDRCLVTAGAGKEIAANRAALEAIVRAWIGPG
jgi:uncharacterized protein YdhG (YjbR/CyaY superfamily)